MDEKFIVGLGHLYSDEILWNAGAALRPGVRQAVLARRSPALQGSDRDAPGSPESARYVGWTTSVHRPRGNPGQYQLELKVFEREGEACKRCRHEIAKVAYRDGFTYFCPQCQS